MGIIYLISNKINGKIYVGLDRKNNQVRWKDHLRHSKEESPIQLIDRKIKEYGEENFNYSEFFQSDDIELLKQKEQEFIKNLSSMVYTDRGYNLTIGGDGCFGFKMPLDRIIKGERHYMYGKHLSEEERNKRRLGMIGKNKGEINGSKKPEARKKISEKAKLRVGTLNPNYRHGKRSNGKQDSEYISNYYLKNRNKIRARARERYLQNRQSELGRAKKYRLTHKKVHGRWVQK